MGVGLWQDAELPQPAQIVPDRPVLDDLPFSESEDVDVLNGERLPAGGKGTVRELELRVMRALPGHACPYLVSSRNQIFNGVSLVRGEAVDCFVGALHSFHAVPMFAPARVVHELRMDELVPIRWTGEAKVATDNQCVAFLIHGGTSVSKDRSPPGHGNDDALRFVRAHSERRRSASPCQNATMSTAPRMNAPRSLR